jgi:processive 1,2-diacylglycerol beta-glucosyltransferase
MKKLSVHVLFEHGTDLKPYGIAHIRDILPLSHPANSDAIQLTYGLEYARADVVIVERTWKPGIDLAEAEKLVAQVRRDGSRLVFSIDDNLLDLEQIPLATRMVLRYFCREADGVLVSTAFLQERLSGLNKSIFVLPNAVDERLFGEAKALAATDDPSEKKIVIGYMGTFTHDSDLMMVYQPLNQVLRRYAGRLEFQLVGGVSNPAVLEAFKGLAFRVLRVPVEDVAYPNFVAWMKKNLDWDLAIAPLEDTRFNLAKSDIKFLDYSALGIPGIYSRVPSYSGTVRHLETGYLVENTPAAWEEALETMLAEDGLREQLAVNARNYVSSSRTLEHCAYQWKEALLAIVSEQSPVVIEGQQV